MVGEIFPEVGRGLRSALGGQRSGHPTTRASRMLQDFRRATLPAPSRPQVRLNQSEKKPAASAAGACHAFMETRLLNGPGGIHAARPIGIVLARLAEIVGCGAQGGLDFRRLHGSAVLAD